MITCWKASFDGEQGGGAIGRGGRDQEGLSGETFEQDLSEKEPSH